MNTGLVNDLYKKKWVVYAKRPFGGPQSVIEYLGRYIHPVRSSRISVSMPFCFSTSNGASKVAISNHRIKQFENGKVTFSYKDYRHGSVNKEMTLEATEFIRRFSMHILPKGLVRIRHYGILSSTSKASSIVIIREQLPAITRANRADRPDRPAQKIYNPARCPCCKKDTMQTMLRFNRRGPPPDWEQIARQLLECVS